MKRFTLPVYFTTASQCLAELERLHVVFQKTNGRKMQAELFLADTPFDGRTIWGITAYYESETAQAVDLAFLKREADMIGVGASPA